MTYVGYPSSDFPPAPRFSLRIPDDWQAAWVSGTLLSVHGREDAEGVTPNVLVAHQRLPVGDGLNEVAEAAMQELGSADPPRELSGPQSVEVEGAIAAAMISGSFRTEGGVTVLQRQLLIQVESVGNGTSVLEVTATYGASDAQTLEEIVGSFEFASNLDDSSLLPEPAS